MATVRSHDDQVDVARAGVLDDRPRRRSDEGISLDEVERQLLTQALERSGGNQTQAGQLLGINRDQVRYRIEKFGLTVKS